jgi:hypothetical protein
MTTTLDAQCPHCIYWKDDIVGTGTCAAFPEGIPFDVWNGLVPHIGPLEGDNGVQFELTRDSRILNAITAEE